MNQYDIWQMDTHGTSRRIAQRKTLADANGVVTDTQRDIGYVYIIKWTTTTNPIAGTVDRVSRYIVGWLDGWKHTRDMRATVRNIMAGAR